MYSHLQFSELRLLVVVSAVQGKPDPRGLVGDTSKAGCIVRTDHTDWNMVRDVDPSGHPVLRVLQPEEEERLMGMPVGYTAADLHGKPLTNQQRHGLIGNSFSVFVVEQLLSPLRQLAAATSSEGAGQAVAALGLREPGSNAAKRWCSECESAACIFAH